MLEQSSHSLTSFFFIRSIINPHLYQMCVTQTHWQRADDKTCYCWCCRRCTVNVFQGLENSFLFKLLTQWSKITTRIVSDHSSKQPWALLFFFFFWRINPVLDEISEAPPSLFAGFFSIFRQSVRVTSSGKAADQPGFTTLFASPKPWRTEKSFNWWFKLSRNMLLGNEAYTIVFTPGTLALVAMVICWSMLGPMMWKTRWLPHLFSLKENYRY